MSFDHIIYKKFANKHIPIAERKRLEFMPDTIPYNHTAEQYSNTWREINDASKGNYFYTDSYTVTRVGWFTYAWQNFIGFFGFTNHCQPARAEMTLQKFAYYGYIKGYHVSQPLVTNTLHSNSVLLFNSARNARNTEQLQNNLLQTYKSENSSLRPGFWLRLFSNEYLHFFTQYLDPWFGLNLSLTEDAELLTHAITLDPSKYQYLQIFINHIKQNPQLEKLILPNGDLFLYYTIQRISDYLNKKISINDIKSTCRTLNFRYNSAEHDAMNKTLDRLVEDEAKNSEEIIEPNSNLAKAFADRLVDDYLANTTSLLKRSVNTVKVVFGFKADMQPAVRKAAALDSTIKERRKDFFIKFYLKTKQFDDALFLIISLKDINQQFQFMTSDAIDPALLKKYVELDSELGKALTRHYLAQDNEAAAQMFTSIDYRHATYPAIYFKQYAETNHPMQAYKLYNSVENKTIFDAACVQQLAQHFNEKAISLKARSKLAAHESSDNGWDKAEHLMMASNQAAECAYHLCNGNDNFKQYAQKAGYNIAKLLVNSPLHSDNRVNRLDAAIQQLSTALEKCSESKSNKISSILLKALFERADIAVNACLTSLDRNYGHSATKEHKTAVLPQAEKALECYRKIVALDPDNTIHGKTAEAHFMIADIETYFDINKNTNDYLRAMELAPLNPFYKLRCAEFHESDREELRAAGLGLLKDNKLSLQDYMDWSAERWSRRDDRVYGIVDAHRFNQEPNESGSLIGTVLSYFNPLSYMPGF